MVLLPHGNVAGRTPVGERFCFAVPEVKAQELATMMALARDLHLVPHRKSENQ